MKALSLILLLVSLSANSSDLSAPQVAIQKYFDDIIGKKVLVDVQPETPVLLENIES